MPPKSTRTRKAPKRGPTSLAAAPIPASSLNQLQLPAPTTLVDPLLLEHDAITTATAANIIEQLDPDAREYEYESPPQFDQQAQPETQTRETSWARTPSRDPFESIEVQVNTNTDTQPTQQTQTGKEQEVKIKWNSIMEETLF
jgi:hypothetical protein